VSLEVLAVGAACIVVTARLLVALIGTHYQAHLHLRHAANEAIARLEAKRKSKAAAKAE
jgi:hypothetical protein